MIQGGMGVGISNWRLAQAVSRRGQLGVVSGTALDQMLARRLQDGAPGGHMRRALARFPVPAVAARVWDRYFLPNGRAPGAGYRAMPLPSPGRSLEFDELCVVANFAEVALAREGHDHPVGINYLEKVQIPHLPSLYGAMLAGVNFVLMGAGIPMRIPGALDRLARHETAEYPLHVTGDAPGLDTVMTFTPSDIMGATAPPLTRPAFLAIVSSDVLAKTLLRKSNGRVDGFVVEGPRAGGHSAPPRGRMELNARGEPVYGARDRVDLDKIAALGLPFWLAGGCGAPEGLSEALARGASGVQVGSAFALCAESGLRPGYRRKLLDQALRGEVRVFNDPHASPTGFPFKVAALEGTLSDDAVYGARLRICDLGYLREAYRQPDGSLGFRCPSEPVSVYVAKGGEERQARGRKCICNALIANAGHAQTRAGRHIEPGLLTIGEDLSSIPRFVAPGAADYSASDVIDVLTSKPLPA
ncbi:MAG: nitronate monooxygenase [Acidobacteriota bacterium]|nr:nitronate monooxygenase [Acidobacteriota bacterium]